MWPADRCNHGSQHHRLGRSPSPAPVITAGGRKEGSPPGSEALAPGSLYSRCSFLSCLPRPETPRGPRGHKDLLPPHRPACPCSLPSPPRTPVRCPASGPARSSPASLPLLPAPDPAAVLSRMMGKCTDFGADRPGWIPSRAPTGCVTLGTLISVGFSFPICEMDANGLAPRVPAVADQRPPAAHAGGGGCLRAARFPLTPRVLGCTPLPRRPPSAATAPAHLIINSLGGTGLCTQLPRYPAPPAPKGPGLPSPTSHPLERC